MYPSQRPVLLQKGMYTPNTIGVDWIPPLNTRLELSRPVLVPSLAPAQIKQLPTEFSWVNRSDVTNKRYPNANNLLSVYVSPPLNQANCGSCWAVAMSSMFADRWRIWSQEALPNFSPTYVMACMHGAQAGCTARSGASDDGCSGGFPEDAGCLFEEKGVPSADCWNYSWCANSANCSAPTQCPNGTCPSNNQPMRLYKAAPKSTKGLAGFDAIKHEVFFKGPVVGAFLATADFIYGSKTGWPETKGIFMNDPQGRIYKSLNVNLSACQNREASSSGSCVLGGHAMVIVGWGVETKIDGWAEPIPYWVVRNSWGADWNKTGFCKFAQSGTYTFQGTRITVNHDIAFDHPLTMQGKHWGGVVLCDPNITQKEPTQQKSSPVPKGTDASCLKPGEGACCRGSKCLHSTQQHCQEVLRGTFKGVGVSCNKFPCTSAWITFGVPIGVLFIVLLLVGLFIYKKNKV